MNRREAASVLNFAGSIDSRIRRSLNDPRQAARTIDEWAEALAHVPATTEDGGWDVAHAIRRFYEQRQGDHTARYFAVEPHHLLAAWADVRSARLVRHTDPVPAADPDDVDAYRAALLDNRRAVAAGHEPPHQYRAALTQRDVATLTAGIGAMPDVIPPAAAEHLRRAGLGSRRDALPELGIACPVPTCRARERRRCVTPHGRELRTHVHGRRRDAWAVHTLPCPECGAVAREPCPGAEPHPARIRASLNLPEGEPAP